MRVFNRLTEWTEHYIRSYVIGKLHQRRASYRLRYRNDMRGLQRALRPGDVILVEGEHWVSDWIKVFSYHTWTHCAIWLGESPSVPAAIDKKFVEPGGNIAEALMGEGVVISNLQKYRDVNLRICRPIGLSRERLRRAVEFVLHRVGSEYDEDNVTQFVHFTFAADYDPTKPIGRMAEGKYTCSSLLAAAFESVALPVLHFYDPATNGYVPYDATHIQPKDFDLSLNFQVIKTPALLPQVSRPGVVQRLAAAFSHRFVA